MATQLNQILAVEKGLNTKSNDEYTTIYRTVQLPNLVEGISKTYRTVLEDGAEYPSDYKGVQLTVHHALDRVASILTRRFDLTLTKDEANTSARADIIIAGHVILASVPVTYLLFLEKQCVELLEFISRLPTLDPAYRWSVDPATSWAVTDVTTTHKTKKIEKVVVLYPATDKHPAQVQLRPEDVVEGYWDTVKFSGALPAARKQELLDNLSAFSEAVKFAREKANTLEVINQQAGQVVFTFLFGTASTLPGSATT